MRASGVLVPPSGALYLARRPSTWAGALWRVRIAFVLLLLLSAPQAQAQAGLQPEFEVEMAAMRGGEAPRLDVYTAVPYSNLRFLARAEGFEASYTVTVQLYRTDARGRQAGLALSRSWEQTARVPTYEATQDGEAEDRAAFALEEVPAGRYIARVAIEDGASQRTATRDVPLTIRAMDGPVAISDPLLLERYEPGAAPAAPHVSAAVSTDDEAFTLFYEVYAEAPASLRATYEVTERNRTQERPSFRSLLGLAPRSQPEAGTPIAVSQPLEVEAGRTAATLRVPTERLGVGDYVVSVRLEDADGQLVAETEKPFAVRWLGLEGQLSDLSRAIAQLRYIAKDRELRAMQNAPTPDEQLRLFRDFWARRDPTPGSRRNERMEEYYYRVAAADQRYARTRASGWDTDRGEVFVRFGDPDRVEEQPVNYGTRPYQIWYYERFGRSFIFVDQGLGEYRLLVPIWDERTRM